MRTLTDDPESVSTSGEALTRACSSACRSLCRKRYESPDLRRGTGVGHSDQSRRISVGERVDHKVAVLGAIDNLSRVEFAEVP